jgi:His/Glu/Gln/Arg/opine family amino acid ABC transporter permease subunit
VSKWAIFLDPGVRAFLWDGIRITLQMAAISVAGSLVLGLSLALLRLSPYRTVRYPAVAVVEFLRALPVLVLILFSFLAVKPLLGLDAFGAASLALTLYTAAVNAEIMRAGITSVERGQGEAARSLGLTYAQTMRYVVLPQAFRRMIPPQVGQLITLVKDTSLAAVIGVAELTQRTRILYQSPDVRESTPQALFLTACLYFLFNYGLSRLSRRWELATGRAPRARAVDAH